MKLQDSPATANLRFALLQLAQAEPDAPTFVKWACDRAVGVARQKVQAGHSAHVADLYVRASFAIIVEVTAYRWPDADIQMIEDGDGITIMVS